MVTRRSPSESADASSNEALREALAECEAKVEMLRQQRSEMRATGGNFLSDAAHAIRSPLTVTHSYLEILYSDLRDGLTQEQQSFLGIAYENAVRLRNLVDDLVDLAAFETGAAEIELAPAVANSLVETVQSDMLPVARRKGVQLTSDVSADLPEVTVDKNRLQDALRRLLDNALRFTPESGSVLLRARQAQNDVIFEVVDSGVGIPADRVADAFQAFVQLHRQPGKNRESYGLGLPLCRRIVEAQGGTLELTSIEGKGTTVTIRIPAKRHA